jgi:hypothetical protein
MTNCPGIVRLGPFAWPVLHDQVGFGRTPVAHEGGDWFVVVPADHALFCDPHLLEEGLSSVAVPAGSCLIRLVNGQISVLAGGQRKVLTPRG